MATFVVSIDPLGNSVAIPIEIEAEPQLIPPGARMQGCPCEVGYYAIGLPAALHSGTNYYRALREQKKVMVCECIGRYVA